MTKSNTEATQWAAQLSAGELNAQQQAALDAWLAAHPGHGGALLRAQAIEHLVDQAMLHETLRPGMDNISASSEARTLRYGHSRRKLLAVGAMAAGVAGITALGGALLRPRPDEPPLLLQTARGEFRTVPLADHSTVSLNGSSQLEVRVGQHQRRVALTQGEAWFKTARDGGQPFIVETGKLLVQAVGAAFAVRRYAGGADVGVTEGMVEVWSANGQPRRRLAAGEQAYLADAASELVIRRGAAEIGRRLAWRNQQVILQNQTLAEAVAEFNRYNSRALVINDPSLQHKKFVGQYRVDQPERFADDVRALLGVPVLVTADRIEIGKRRR